MMISQLFAHFRRRFRPPTTIFWRWLGLTIAGLVAYVLLRALWTVIELGTLLADWQWYVPLSLCLILLPIRLSWQWPSGRLAWLAFGGALVWLLTGYAGFGASEHLQVAGTPPIRISYWAYTDFRHMPESVLADLHATHATLYLHAPTTSFEDVNAADLTTGLQRLATYQIPVLLAPPASDFLSAPVHREWIDHASRAAAYIHRTALPNLRGVIGDAEAPLHAPLVELATARQDVAVATQALRTFIDHFHHQYPDLQVGITAEWPLYLDGADGDADLATLWRSPVDPPGDWDFVNVMTYSSYLPRDQQAYWVVAVERGMAHRYPTSRRSYLLGLVGGGFAWEPVLDFEGLVRDARISRALGAQDIVVFQLNGALQAFGTDFVRRLDAAVNGADASISPIEVPVARLVSLEIYGLALLDALCDFGDVAKLEGLAWMGISALISYWWAAHQPRAAQQAVAVDPRRSRRSTRSGVF